MKFMDIPVHICDKVYPKDKPYLVSSKQANCPFCGEFLRSEQMKMNDLKAEVTSRFKHYPPRNPDEIRVHENIREICRACAIHLIDALPNQVLITREFSQVLTDLENAMMHANAAYARHKPEEIK